jgi:hypothetical protein
MKLSSFFIFMLFFVGMYSYFVPADKQEKLHVFLHESAAKAKGVQGQGFNSLKEVKTDVLQTSSNSTMRWH